MCRRSDSIAAVSAAADTLAETCEAAMRAPPPRLRIAAGHPRSGIGRALRAAFSELLTTPADMAINVGKLGGEGKCSKH